MKSNAHLYLPWSVITELAASTGSQLSEAKSDRPRMPVVSAEALDGGCVLYRVTAFAGGTVGTLSERHRATEKSRSPISERSKFGVSLKNSGQNQVLGHGEI
jgi:hypothetical protein